MKVAESNAREVSERSLVGHPSSLNLASLRENELLHGAAALLQFLLVKPR